MFRTAAARIHSTSTDARPRTAQWQLRATTTSPTFHDAGVPEAQYYVTTRDANGNELAQSTIVTIDLVASRLPAPLGLGVDLAQRGDSTGVAAATRSTRRTARSTTTASTRRHTTRARRVHRDWVVEGTTVSDAFLAGNLANGVVAVLRRQRDHARRTRERRGATRASTRRASTRATRSSTRRPLAATAPASSFSTTSAEKLGVVGVVDAHGSRLHDRASRGRLALVRAGAQRRDDGALLDAAGRRPDVDRSRASDGLRQRDDRSGAGLRVRVSHREGGRRPLRRRFASRS